MFGLSLSQATPATTKRGWLVFPALAMLPDADVVAFAFGIPYASEFGHRGASHAIVTALIVGALVGYVFMRTKSGALPEAAQLPASMTAPLSSKPKSSAKKAAVSVKFSSGTAGSATPAVPASPDVPAAPAPSAGDKK